MAKVKSLFKPIIMTTAGRSRKCYHSKSHSISKGDFVLEIRDGQITRGYCCVCAKQMLEQAAAQLTSFEANLTPHQ